MHTQTHTHTHTYTHTYTHTHTHTLKNDLHCLNLKTLKKDFRCLSLSLIFCRIPGVFQIQFNWPKINYPVKA